MINDNNGTNAAIKYEVTKHHALSKNKGKDIYRARVTAPTKSLREVAQTMVREGSKYDAGEVVAILEKFADVTTRLLQEGYAINVGSLVRFSPSIRGTFTSADAAFSKSEHRIVVKATVGSVLRDVAATAAVQRITAVAFPEIEKVYNGLTGTENTLCSEGPLVLLGKRLIWDEKAEDEGFFLNIEGQLTKCTVFSVDTARTSVFLHTDVLLVEGATAELEFHTRNTTSGELATFNYSTPIMYEASLQN